MHNDLSAEQALLEVAVGGGRVTVVRSDDLPMHILAEGGGNGTGEGTGEWKVEQLDFIRVVVCSYVSQLGLGGARRGDVGYVGT
eukprot:1699485-Pleurochrysis_carterae.AAC.1